MALKDFVSGEVLTADDVDVYLKNTIFARKTATESVTSSTALQDDNELTVSVAANSVYEVTLMLIYDGATGGDLKFDFTGPSGATMNGVALRLGQGAATGDDDAQSTFVMGTPEGVGALGTGSNAGMVFHGLLDLSATAGTFKLQWAQATSSGTATRVFADSYICLRRVD